MIKQQHSFTMTTPIDVPQYYHVWVNDKYLGLYQEGESITAETIEAVTNAQPYDNPFA